MATIVVMHARPYDPSVTATVLVPEGPDGPIPDGSHTDIVNNGGLTDVYAVWGASGYTTAAADTPASTYMPGKITQPFGYNFQIFGDEDLTQPGAFSGGGALTISDPDGELDDWLDYAWDGRDITLYRGDSGAAFSTFSVVARLTCDGWGEISKVKKSLKIRDLGWKFAAPIPLARYTGTGGAEGASDIAGKTKPQVIHSVFYCPAVLLDSVSLIYQYHDPMFEALTLSDVPSVTVGGVFYSWAGDFASYSDLAGATIAAGYYGSCVAQGMVRLGSALPQGQELRIGTAWGLAGNLTPLPEDILTTVVEKIGAAIPGMSSGITADVSVSGGNPTLMLLLPMADAAASLGEILDALTYGAGWYWWPSLTGSTVYVRALVDPAGETATIEIDANRAYIAATEVSVSLPVPQYEQSVSYGRRWSPQPRASLAGSVSEATAQTLIREYLLATESDAIGAGVAHPSARSAVRISPFSVVARARQRARELLEIFKVQRYIVTLRVGDMDPLDPPIGQIVDLQNFNRLGFGASKQFLCIGCKANLARNSLELTLWG